MRHSEHDGKAALDRAKGGAKLKRSERLAAIAHLDHDIGPVSVGEMAELFQVSERQIHKDNAELRSEYQRAAMELDLVGEFYRAYRQQLAFIDRRLNADGLEESDRIGLLRERRALLFGFQDRIAAVRLEHLLGKAETNGHSSRAPSAS